MIPYGRQDVDDDDIAAVVDVLRGDWLTQGPAVERFEEALAATVGARHAVAFSNGTAALHAAAAAAGLGPGDIVATSALTFVASANCARYVGASVSLVDIEAATLNLDPERVPPDADALVAVHYAGLPVDLTRLPRRPRVVIEDAAHALGATTPDGPVGNCAHSDMCAFSFHPVKHVTTGEGGAVTTNDPALAAALHRFRNHGIERRPECGGWYYEIVDTGFNYRLTDMQAALGTSQLRRLETFLARRNQIADAYRAAFADVDVTLPPAPPTGWRHAYHLYPVRVTNRAAVYEAMHRAGIRVQVHYVPLYRHPILSGSGGPADFPATEAAYRELLSLPMYPALTDDARELVVDTLSAAIST
jgi:UDP-4-amino-4,6-dideoxy-N-acetyl-beta-L-altrosamine transaminase